MSTEILVFILGVFAGVLDVIIGTGSILTIPALVLVGLPPHLSVATSKLGGLGSNLAPLHVFHRNGQIRWQLLFPLSLVGVFGGVVGSNILLKMNSDMLTDVIGFAMILTLPLLFLKKELGLVRMAKPAWSQSLGFLLLLIVVIYGGFLGIGVGPVVWAIMIVFFGLTFIEANATLRIPWCWLTLSSIVVLAIHGAVDFWLGGALLFGTMCGSSLGARLLILKGNSWAKSIFAGVSICAGLRLIFW